MKPIVDNDSTTKTKRVTVKPYPTKWICPIYRTVSEKKKDDFRMKFSQI